MIITEWHFDSTLYLLKFPVKKDFLLQVLYLFIYIDICMNLWIHSRA